MKLRFSLRKRFVHLAAAFLLAAVGPLFSAAALRPVTRPVNGPAFARPARDPFAAMYGGAARQGHSFELLLPAASVRARAGLSAGSGSCEAAGIAAFAGIAPRGADGPPDGVFDPLHRTRTSGYCWGTPVHGTSLESTFRLLYSVGKPGQQRPRIPSLRPADWDRSVQFAALSSTVTGWAFDHAGMEAQRRLGDGARQAPITETVKADFFRIAALVEDAW